MKGERRSTNRTRMIVLNYVREHPGSTLPEIRKVLDLPEGTARYHIEYLRNEDKLFHKKKRGINCFYANDLDGQNSILSDDPEEISREQSRILKTIRSNPGITYRDLVSSTGINRKHISRNIESLKRKGIVWQVKNGGDPGYEYITDDVLRMEKLKLLVLKLLEGEIDEETFMILKEEIIGK